MGPLHLEHSVSHWTTKKVPGLLLFLFCFVFNEFIYFLLCWVLVAVQAFF